MNLNEKESWTASTKEEYLQMVDIIDNQIHELNLRKNEVIQKYGQAFPPFQVGQTVLYNNGEAGIETCKVLQIKPSSAGFPVQWYIEIELLSLDREDRSFKPGTKITRSFNEGSHEFTLAQ